MRFPSLYSDKAKNSSINLEAAYDHLNFVGGPIKLFDSSVHTKSSDTPYTSDVEVMSMGTFLFLQDSITLCVPSIFVNSALLTFSIMY